MNLRKFILKWIEILIIIVSIIIIYWIIWIFNAKLNPNEFGDSINPILALVTIYLVYRTFQLQKDAFQSQKLELIETKKVLEGQEKSIKEQRTEQMIMNLLELSRNHLSDFRRILEDKKYLGLNPKKDIIVSYVERILDINEDIQKGILNSVIYYFRTLKYIEDQVLLEYNGNDKKIKKYILLLETQITENLRTLHGLLLSSKDGIDKELITFKYLFSNREIEPDIPKEKPKLGISRPKF